MELELLIALIHLVTAVLAFSAEVMKRRRGRDHPEARDSDTSKEKSGR